jgi:sugar O-acyltransferase (sialic acid O-acetyltransferase NeuD family)
MKNKKKLIIWGATGQSIVLEEFLSKEYSIEAIFDNNKKIKSPFKNVNIFYGKRGFKKWLKNKKAKFYFIVAIGGGYGKDRKEISNYLIKNNLIPISAINKKSNIAANAKLGKGVQILMGANVGSRCKISDYVILNTSASIDHDCQIREGVHVGPGAKLAGSILIDKYTYIGIGAIILPFLKIGKNCVIGAGSVLTKNVPDFTIVYGNPAKIKGKTNE